jgi:hypothetical protein
MDLIILFTITIIIIIIIITQHLKILCLNFFNVKFYSTYFKYYIVNYLLEDYIVGAKSELQL